MGQSALHSVSKQSRQSEGMEVEILGIITVTHLLLRSIGGADLLGREGLEQESAAVSGRQRISLRDGSQLLEDGPRLTQERTSPHLEETSGNADLTWALCITADNI